MTLESVFCGENALEAFQQRYDLMNLSLQKELTGEQPLEITTTEPAEPSLCEQARWQTLLDHFRRT